ncbi:MAG: SMC-Scp complex subunit ScpB [Lentisphaerota bacterium]
MSNPDTPGMALASSLQQVVGALIFGSERPLSIEDIRTCLQEVGALDEQTRVFADAAPREVRDAVEGIAKDLSRLGLGIELAEHSEGFRFQTQACTGRWLRHMLKADRPGRLSRPALETLAIIAYRQPIAKSEIEAVRGVAVDHIIKALMELHLVRIVGRSDLPGRPFLYGTTASFLEHFGLKNLTDLNALDPTLQRSRPADRRALHRKAKPDKSEGAPAGAPDAQTGTAAVPAPVDAAAEDRDLHAAVREILGPREEPGADAEPVFETDEELDRGGT